MITKIDYTYFKKKKSGADGIKPGSNCVTYNGSTFSTLHDLLREYREYYPVSKETAITGEKIVVDYFKEKRESWDR